ncbi:hypothetical protein [Coralloluteibacterium stylophorae]|uniref:Uncharacterized protein n=1 Tax=Coralloluteibacterium stylophorae TaxID=1776034 RepID=A0A8J8AWX2_9GAMM|nr:hypothetical protein [Coralloluteibacterium stylophorae]MBS7456915.1 hypothetical protein [Coralloluteibacterium stylophorae]
MNGKSSLDRSSGTASGSGEHMSGPAGDRETENRLHEVDTESRGEFLEDHQRDRQSKGVAGGYDDSLERRKGDDEHRDRRGVTRGD